jgi:hypothetical protein
MDKKCQPVRSVIFVGSLSPPQYFVPMLRHFSTTVNKDSLIKFYQVFQEVMQRDRQSLLTKEGLQGAGAGGAILSRAC